MSRAPGTPPLVDSPTRTFFSKQKDDVVSNNAHGSGDQEKFQPTLADIKRRSRREAEEARNEGHVKRFQTLNFTSENSRHLDEADLRPYYCSVCGYHCCIIEGGFDRLPLVNHCRVVHTEKVFHKLYIQPSDEVLIRKREGVEARVMYRCTECQFQLAYRVKAGKEDSFTEHLYIPCDSLVNRQADAAAFGLTLPDAV